MPLGVKGQSNGRAAVFVTCFESGESICHHMKRLPVDVNTSAATRFHDLHQARTATPLASSGPCALV